MPSERPKDRLSDIIENAASIQRYTANMDLAFFEADPKTRDAVERCLERICEAAAKLGAQALTMMPDQPWAEIRSLGNRLRHEYDLIRPDRLWDIIRIDVPSLKSACAKALQELPHDDHDS